MMLALPAVSLMKVMEMRFKRYIVIINKIPATNFVAGIFMVFLKR